MTYEITFKSKIDLKDYPEASMHTSDSIVVDVFSPIITLVGIKCIELRVYQDERITYSNVESVQPFYYNDYE